MTPYEALYGHPLPNYLVAAVDSVTSQDFKGWVEDRARLTKELKDRLQVAQSIMKQQADRHRKEEYAVGDWVYLKLQPYRQTIVAIRRHIKLAARYYGPFRILKLVGPVAYNLQLSEGSRVHPVLIPCLPSKEKSPNSSPGIPESTNYGRE